MPVLHKVSDNEMTFGLVLQDRYLFTLLFWGDELSLPPTVEQRMMLTDASQRQIWCTGRKIVKTLSIERDLMWYPVQNLLSDSTTLQEAMFVTPRESHIVPTRDRMFSKINNTPFFRMLVKDKNKSGGGVGTIESISHWKWHFRIEGVSGSDENMAGLRARVILGDEMAYGIWVTHNSRIMTAFPDANLKYCGVPNGVRDTPFYQLDTSEKMQQGWSHHKYPSFVNPLYQSREAQERLERDYGGKSTQGYLNNVLGEWGEEAYTSFPAGSIAVDKSLPVTVKELHEKPIVDNLDNLSRILMLPFIPDCHYAVGLDYGYSPDPTVITIAYSKDMLTWRESARLTLYRVKLPTQARFIHWLCSQALQWRVRKVSTDSIQLLQSVSEIGHHYGEVVHFSDPGGTTVIKGLDGKPMLGDDGRELKKRNKQFLTDELKIVFQSTLIGAKYPVHLWLADDQSLIEAVSGLTERRTPAGYTVYETSTPVEEHPKDSLLYLLSAILAVNPLDSPDPMAEYEKVLGWAGPKRTWTAPWS